MIQYNKPQWIVIETITTDFDAVESEHKNHKTPCHLYYSKLTPSNTLIHFFGHYFSNFDGVKSYRSEDLQAQCPWSDRVLLIYVSILKYDGTQSANISSLDVNTLTELNLLLEDLIIRYNLTWHHVISKEDLNRLANVSTVATPSLFDWHHHYTGVHL